LTCESQAASRRGITFCAVTNVGNPNTITVVPKAEFWEVIALSLNRVAMGNMGFFFRGEAAGP